MVNYDSALLTRIHINFSKIPSLCWAFAKFCEHKQGGGHSRAVCTAGLKPPPQTNFYNLWWNNCGIGVLISFPKKVKCQGHIKPLNIWQHKSCMYLSFFFFYKISSYPSHTNLCTYLRSCIYLSPLAISLAIWVSLSGLTSSASLSSRPTRFLLESKYVFKSPTKRNSESIHWLSSLRLHVHVFLLRKIIVIFLGLMEVSTPKWMELHHARSTWFIRFPSVFGVDTAINPKNIAMISYNFVSVYLNDSFDLDVSIANDVSIDLAKCAPPGKVMQGPPCSKVRTFTNINGRYVMKLNDWFINCRFFLGDVKIWSNEKIHLNIWNITSACLTIQVEFQMEHTPTLQYNVYRHYISEMLHPYHADGTPW